LWGALSDERTGLSFVYAAGSLPVQSFSGPSLLGLATIFYCLRFETSFSSPLTTRRVTVEVFDSASTRGLDLHSRMCSLCSLESNRIENKPSNNSSIVAWASVAAETCLPSRYHATDNVITSQYSYQTEASSLISRQSRFTHLQAPAAHLK
jgi:hypothetical protein